MIIKGRGRGCIALNFMVFFWERRAQREMHGAVDSSSTEMRAQGVERACLVPDDDGLPRVLAFTGVSRRQK